MHIIKKLLLVQAVIVVFVRFAEQFLSFFTCGPLPRQKIQHWMPWPTEHNKRLLQDTPGYKWNSWSVSFSWCSMEFSAMTKFVCNYGLWRVPFSISFSLMFRHPQQLCRAPTTSDHAYTFHTPFLLPSPLFSNGCSVLTFNLGFIEFQKRAPVKTSALPKESLHISKTRLWWSMNSLNLNDSGFWETRTYICR